MDYIPKMSINNRLASILVSLLILVNVTSRLEASPTEHLQSHHNKQYQQQQQQQPHNYHRNNWSHWHRNQLHKNGTASSSSSSSSSLSSSLSHHPRVLHDSLLRKQRNRDDELTRHDYYDIDGVIKSAIATQRSNANNNNEDKENNSPGKLRVIAGAEYSGTRAVAFAGYHNPERRDFVTSREGFTSIAPYPTITTSTPSYTRHHAGRRVCSRLTPISVNHHHASRQIRFVYTEVGTSSFNCCPGWSQVTRTSYGCNRPTCIASCHNGGVCGPHGKCNCPKGFTGSQCQLDVDECMTEKPCAQFCTNLPGSYECHCRYGFYLQPDGQSCKKNDSDGTAFEARDLENDYGIETSTTKRPVTTSSHDTENEVSNGDVNKDYEIILRRLTKLEKQFARGKKKDTETTELSTKVNEAVEGVVELRLAAKNVLHFLRETFGPMRQEVYDMKNKFELERRRVDHLLQRFLELDHRLNLHQRING